MAPLLPARQLSWFTLSHLSSCISLVINESSTSCQNLNTLFIQEIILAQSLSAFQTHVNGLLLKFWPSQFLLLVHIPGVPSSTVDHAAGLSMGHFICNASCALWLYGLWPTPVSSFHEFSGRILEMSCHAFLRGNSLTQKVEPVFPALLADPLQIEPPEALDYFTSSTKSTLWLC